MLTGDIKSFIRSGYNRVHVAEYILFQALCKAFALEFNGLLNIEPALDFLVTSCLQDKSRAGTATGESYLMLEPFTTGQYVKYNNNAMYMHEKPEHQTVSQVAQAFSHFTFERS